MGLYERDYYAEQEAIERYDNYLNKQKENKMKVRLNSVQAVKKNGEALVYPSKFKPGEFSHLMKFKQYLPEGDRDVSGFVPSTKLASFVDGAEHDLDITQNDKGYWGFQFPTKTSATTAAVAEENKANHEKVMEALRLLYAKCQEIDAKLEKLTEGPIQP